MHWYQNWFNTPYYHILYGNRNNEEAEFFIDNLLQKLQLPEQVRAWDLNCGKGRHAVYLNKKNMQVIATDLSEESIQAAKKQENNTLHFYRHDMRNLFYTQYFDVVFNLFTSFGYFKNQHDDKRVFKVVAQSLKKNGLFVLDFLNATYVKKNMIPAEEKECQGIRFSIKKKTEHNFVIKEIAVQDGQHTSCFKEEVHLLTKNDFSALAQQAGLKIKHCFGNYKLQNFDENTSERLILIFEK
ncbi:MAG: class I SAM-dependent methyltransferase [Bacteroidetes bacterium]|nr:class I SAM-dependent methyltransferase [Bacteroidota bacterium]